MYIYIYIYIYMYVCVCVCVCVYIYIRRKIHIYIYIYIYICMYVNTPCKPRFTVYDFRISDFAVRPGGVAHVVDRHRYCRTRVSI